MNAQWCFEEDRTRPVFTAEEHVKSKHVQGKAPRLPRRAVVFCLGRGLPLLAERFPTQLLCQRLPGFITHTPVLAVEGWEGLCFLDGGRGAPQAACVIETLHALGTEEILLLGLCGAFGEAVQVGDVLLPARLLCEEGVSRHYLPDPETAVPQGSWSFGQLAEAFQGAGLRVRRENTVTTDAVYRQTFYKEARWRSLGYAGVDMEASAAVSVCGYYGMGSAVALMASDKHPLEPGAPAWAWGNENFAEKRDRFLEAGIRLARDGL